MFSKRPLKTASPESCQFFKACCAPSSSLPTRPDKTKTAERKHTRRLKHKHKRKQSKGYLMRRGSPAFNSYSYSSLYAKPSFPISKNPAAGISLSRRSRISVAFSMDIRRLSSPVGIGGSVSSPSMLSLKLSALSAQVTSRTSTGLSKCGLFSRRISSAVFHKKLNLLLFCHVLEGRLLF